MRGLSVIQMVAMSNDARFVRAVFVIEQALAPKTEVLTARFGAIGIDRASRGRVPAVEMTAGLVLVLFQFANTERDAAAVALATNPLSHWSTDRSAVNPENFCAIRSARARAFSGHELSITRIVRAQRL